MTTVSNCLCFGPLLSLSIGALAPEAVAAETPGRISIAREGSQLTLSWDSVAGRSYRLISNADLDDPWEEAVTESEPLVAANDRLSYSVNVQLEARFYRVTELAELVPRDMALIPPGHFAMGNALDPNEGSASELPVHTVYVSAYFMDTYPVTRALWDEVKAWASANGYDFDHLNSGQGSAADHPAHSMTWYDAAKWCNARSEKAGLTPCYYIDADLRTVWRTGQVAPQVNWTANGYRLPTEAEWEKAARGGVGAQRFPWGNTISHSLANYRADVGLAYDASSTDGYHPSFARGTSPVGYFAPNAYELYDMAGNVLEWCWDWYSASYYSVSPSSDPRGPTSGSSRTLRGGSWPYNAVYCRTANRYFVNPAQRYDDLGFRSVRAAGQ